MTRLLLTLALLLWATTAQAQVTFDACSSSSGSGTSITFAHTVAVQSDLVLYVAVAVDSAGNFNPTVTYNAVSMTDLGVEVTTNRYLTVFRLVAPATGANNVVVSSLPGGGDEAVFACSFYGVDQTTPEDTPVTTNGAGATSVSVSVTTPVNDMAWNAVTVNSTAGLAGGGGQTVPTNGTIDMGSSEHGTGYQTGSGTVSPSWSWTSSTQHAQIGLNINAVAGGGGGGGCPGMLLRGVCE